MLRKIGISEFKDLYRKHIINDFPSMERPSLKRFVRRIKSYNENVYIYEEEGIKKAYTIIANLDDYVLVSFLAVYKEFRSQGIGTKLLKEVSNICKNKKAILLEVENPEKAENEKDREIRKRRIKFYERAGYKIIDNVRAIVYFQDYKIMALNTDNKDIDIEETCEKLEKHYMLVFKKKNKEYIKIIRQ